MHRLDVGPRSRPAEKNARGPSTQLVVTSGYAEGRSIGKAWGGQQARLLELEWDSTVLDMMMNAMKVAMTALIAKSGKQIMTIVHLQLRLVKRMM